MEVSRNDPTFKYELKESEGGLVAVTQSSIPIRLELASRIMANWTGPFGDKDERLYAIKIALAYADELIKAHNETCGGE